MSKSAAKASKNVSVVPEAPPQPVTAPPEDPLRLELMKRFLTQREVASSDVSEFNNAKQAEWLRYFGFSMERELLWAKVHPEQFKPKVGDASTTRYQRAVEEALKASAPENYGRRQRPHSPPPGQAFGTFTSTTASDKLSSTMGSSTSKKAGVGGTKHPTTTTTPSPTTSSVAGEDEVEADGFARSDDPIQGNKPVEGANGAAFLAAMAAPIAEADTRAFDAPAYEGKGVAQVAEQLTQPYANVTWRADSAQCALMKARVVYRWLCKHMRLVLPQPGSGVGGGGADGPQNGLKGHGKTLTFADLPSAAAGGAGGSASTVLNNNAAPNQLLTPTAGSLPGTPSAGKSALSRKSGGPERGERASSIVVGEGSGERMQHGAGLPHHGHISSAAANAASATVTASYASDAVLASRAGNPRALSLLYSDFLLSCGVESTVVKGALKGSLDVRGKPSGYMKWGWVIVVIPPAPSTNNKPLRLLVDLSLSMASVRPTAGLPNGALTGGDGRAGTGPSGLGSGSGNSAALGPAAGGTGAVAGGGGATASAGATGLAAKQSPRPLSPQQARMGRSRQGGASEGREEDARGAAGEAAAMAAWYALQSERTRYFSAANPRFNVTYDLTPHFEPFYFGCDPRHFASLHYPDEPEKYLLLQQHVARPQWESYPRLTHLFYRHKLELRSHKRRTIIQCRSAPLYISFGLGDCAHVELTAAIFKGGISQQNPLDPALGATSLLTTPSGASSGLGAYPLNPFSSAILASSAAPSPSPPPISPPSPSSTTAGAASSPFSLQQQQQQQQAQPSNALGPGYVYSQRSEKDATQTFTLMAPDVGLYTVVFGARTVNTTDSSIGGGDSNPTNTNSFITRGTTTTSSSSSSSASASVVCNTPFDIVATYQVQMNFVSLNEPILPHQHLTATTLKLVEPRAHKAIVGTQRFVVVPTTPRVLSVAVINRLFRHSQQPSNSVVAGPNVSLPVLPALGVGGGGFGAATPQSLQQLAAGGGVVRTVSSSSGASLPVKRSMGKNSARGQPDFDPSSFAAQQAGGGGGGGGGGASPQGGMTQPATASSACIPSTTTATAAAVPSSIRVTMLELCATTGTFEGDVDLGQGTAEVWALVGDPRSLANTIVHTASRISGMAQLARSRNPTSAAAATATKPCGAGGLLPPLGGASTAERPLVATPTPQPLGLARPQQQQQPLSSSTAGESSTNLLAVAAAAAQAQALVSAAAARYPNSQLLSAMTPEAIAALPAEEPPSVRNGSGGRIDGEFVPAITEIMVVRRILPKEAGLNEGRGVIQPVLAEEGRLGADLPYIFRLMSESTRDGRRRTSESDVIIGKPLNAVGSYFADRH